VRAHWEPKALKEAGKLPRAVRERVVAGVQRFAATGHGDVKKLQGVEGEYRLRIGEYRVLFGIDAVGDVMVVHHVQPRGSAYRG
jgi:mRNA interferase RelE/StbE